MRAAPFMALGVFASISLVFSGVFTLPATAQDEQNVAYSYDQLGRIKTVTYLGLASNGDDIVYTYEYDPAGNRTLFKVEGSAFSAVALEDVYGIEGETLQIPVVVVNPLQQAVSFEWEVISGADQVIVGDRSGTFSLTAVEAMGLVGQVGTIELTTVDDSSKESHAEVVIQLKNAENLWVDPLDDTSSVFLQDNDVTYFTFTNQAGFEGSAMQFLVSKVTPSGAPSETITVTFSTTDLEAVLGTDYEQVTPITLDFAPSDTELPVSVNALADAEEEVSERFVLEASWTSESLYSGKYGAYGTIDNGAGALVGESLYTTPGTHTWTAPTGVTSVNAVCIGAGGGRFAGIGRVGGSGGGLGWRNNITVVPGQDYTVVVGTPGTGTSGQDGGNSYFVNQSTVMGEGGSGNSNVPDNHTGWGAQAGFVGDGGGQGGAGGVATHTKNAAGGGGAGGYTGSGGRGRYTSKTETLIGTATSGSGGGGGGGGTSGTATGGGGGGVGLYGIGANGAGSQSSGGDGGSGGANGASTTNGTGGAYGGGAGARGSSAFGATAGSGACRIMWGPGLSFPDLAELSDATPGGPGGPGGPGDPGDPDSGTGSPSTFTVSSDTKNEGDDATLTISRGTPADREYTVTLTILGAPDSTATEITDYTHSVPTELTFLDGELSKNISFFLATDGTVEAAETIVLEAAWSDDENGAQTATGTITINDVAPSNIPPVANSDVESITLTPTDFLDANNMQYYEGTAVFDVLVNDTDADGDPLSIAPGSLGVSGQYAPSGGPSIASINGRDGISLDFRGCAEYTIHYRAQDTNGGVSPLAQLFVSATPEGNASDCLPPGDFEPVDPPAPTPIPDIWLEGPSAGVSEGGDLTYTVKMTNAYSGTISVVWQPVGGTAIAGTDYILPSVADRTVHIYAGSQKSFSINTLADADVVDGDKTLIIGLQPPNIGNITEPSTATGTILDDDVAGNSSPVLQPDYANVVMTEIPFGQGFNYFGDGTFDVLANDSDPDAGDTLTLLNTVQLLPEYGGVHTVGAANGQIYATFSQCGRYRFSYEVADSSGARSTSFLDVRTDPNGTLPNCSVATAPLDEPAPVVVIGDAAAVTEGQSLLFPVTLSKSYPDPVRINWTVSAGAADVDQTSGILNFNPGEPLTKNISLLATDDAEIEGTETVTVTLDATQVNAVLGAVTSGAGTVTDNDSHPTFSVTGPGGIPEGQDLVFTIDKVGSSSFTYTVDYSITLGTASAGDIGSVPMSGSLTFTASDTSKTVVVPTVDDSDWEQAESVTVTITGITNGGIIGTASGQGNISNNDGEPIINIFNTSVFEGNSGTKTVTVTVFLQGGTSQPVTVDYRTTAGTATAGSDYVEVASGSMTIQPGSYEGTFDVTINGDTSIEGDEYFNTEVVSATNARTVTSNINPENPDKGSNGIVTIKDDDSYSYSWQYGSWSSWSSCTGQANQSRTRSKTCKRSDGTTVSNSFCGSSQATSQSQACSYSFSYGPWSAWSTCSGSSQSRTRSATCESSTGHTVNNSVCGTPVTSQTQSCTPAYTYSWDTGTWSSWSACTGQANSQRTRSVTCKRDQDGATVGDGNCSGTKPATSQNTACSYSWFTGTWSSWSCVGVGAAEERYRSVYCRSNTGDNVSSSNCTGAAPDNFEVRDNPAVCGGGGL